MDVVYARATTYVTTHTGFRVLVQIGSHWYAKDPVVEQFPELFTDDASYGMRFTVPPEAAPPASTPTLPQPKKVETATKKVDPK